MPQSANIFLTNNLKCMPQVMVKTKMLVNINRVWGGSRLPLAHGLSHKADNIPLLRKIMTKISLKESRDVARILTRGSRSRPNRSPSYTFWRPSFSSAPTEAAPPFLHFGAPLSPHFPLISPDFPILTLLRPLFFPFFSIFAHFSSFPPLFLATFPLFGTLPPWFWRSPYN